MKTHFAGGTVRVLIVVAFAAGVVCILVSLLLLGLSALGHAGVLADVGPAENRAMGVQLLSFGLPPLIGGAVLCGVAWWALARNRRRAAPEPRR